MSSPDSVLRPSESKSTKRVGFFKNSKIRQSTPRRIHYTTDFDFLRIEIALGAFARPLIPAD